MTGSDLHDLLKARDMKPGDFAVVFGVHKATVYRLLAERDELPVLWCYALSAFKKGLKPL